MIRMDLLTEFKVNSRRIWCHFSIKFLEILNVMITIQLSKYEKIDKRVTGEHFSKIKNNFPQDDFSD